MEGRREKIYLKAPVKRVVFGLVAEMDNHYLETLEYLKNYNKTHKSAIDVTKCRLRSDKYQLEADKQFDLEGEIKNLKAEKNKRKELMQPAIEYHPKTETLEIRYETVNE